MEKEQRKLIKLSGMLTPINSYEVTEEEIKILKKGAGTHIYLKAAIAMGAMTISSFITLLTVGIESFTSSQLVIIYATLSMGGLLAAILLLAYILQNSKFDEIIRRIEERIELERKNATQEEEEKNLREYLDYIEKTPIENGD